jgi:hypothetical protein
MNYFLPILALAVLLTGCTKSGQQESGDLPDDWQSYENTALNYRIGIPEAAYIPNKSPTSEQVFFGNIKMASENKGNEYDIYLYGDSKTLSNCSPFLTGASEMIQITEITGTAWGKVDFWDDNHKRRLIVEDALRRGEQPPAPLCAPPAPPNGTTYFECPTTEEKRTLSPEEINSISCRQRRRDHELQHGINSAYALCSEKNGKTIVICVSQVTDNPDFAKQIFETFRWTD